MNMKAITKHLMMAAAALLFTTACSNENDEGAAPSKQGKLVQFEMTLSGVNSRTVTGTDASRTTTWVEGDAVGIFALKRGDATLVATNAKYVLTGDKWVAAAGSEIYAEGGQAYDYYAYYPYTGGVTDPNAVSIAVKADQSQAGGADYGLSDVMASQNTTVAADAANIPLVFKHLFAMIEVKVTGDLVTKKPTSVVLKGVKLGSTLNLMGETPTAVTNTTDAATDVTMYYLTKTENDAAVPFSYRAVVPAQTIALGTPLVAINSVNEGNKNYEFQYSKDVTYEAGKYRQINVNIGTPKPSIEIPKGDMTIDPWGDSEPIGGGGSEVVVPVTSITPPITMGMAFKEMEAWASNTLISGNTDFWFHREKNPLATTTTLTVVEDEGVPVIKATNGASQGSWNNDSFGFHSTALFERGVRNEATGVGQRYVLSLKIKSSIVGGAVVGVKTAGDDMTFQCVTSAGADWARTLAFTTVKVANVWETFSIDINFAQKNVDTKSANILPASWEATVDADVKGVNIYIYHNTKDCTLLIKDITLTKYVAPVP